MIIVPDSDSRDSGDGCTGTTTRHRSDYEPAYVSDELPALKMDRGIHEAEDGPGIPLEDCLEQIRDELDL